MPELLAKTPDGKTCVLKIEDGEVTLSYEKGFIGKSLVKEKGFRLSQTTGVRVENGVKPYTSSAKLTIDYLEEGEERELSVFSRRAEKAEELRALVEADNRRRREALDKTLREFKETREAELNHLQLDLELAEGLFTLVEGLHGAVDWGKTWETLDQVERMEEEREALSSPPAVRMRLEGMRNLLSRRHPLELKAEAWDSLETLYHGVHEAAEHSPLWFNRRYCVLLTQALFHAWDGRLAEALDEGQWGVDGALYQALDEACEMLLKETGVTLGKPGSFETLRHWVYEAVDVLMGVELDMDVTSVELG